MQLVFGKVLPGIACPRLPANRLHGGLCDVTVMASKHPDTVMREAGQEVTRTGLEGHGLGDKIIHACKRKVRGCPALHGHRGMAQYKDVFEDIQGMPPVRSHTVYHAFHLKKETQPMLRSLYRLSQAETARVKRHVHEILYCIIVLVQLSLASALMVLLFYLCRRGMDP